MTNDSHQMPSFPDPSGLSSIKASMPSEQQQKTLSAIGGTAAAGGGTLLVILAQILPNPWSLWLRLATPTLSVMMGVLFTRMWEGWKRRQCKRELEIAFSEFEKTLMQSLQNEQIPDDHKQGVRDLLATIQKLKFDVQLNRIKVLSSAVRILDKQHAHTLAAHVDDLQSSRGEKHEAVTGPKKASGNERSPQATNDIDKEHALSAAASASNLQNDDKENDKM